MDGSAVNYENWESEPPSDPEHDYCAVLDGDENHWQARDCFEDSFGTVCHAPKCKDSFNYSNMLFLQV